jgi:hypothetical protein
MTCSSGTIAGQLKPLNVHEDSSELRPFGIRSAGQKRHATNQVGISIDQLGKRDSYGTEPMPQAFSKISALEIVDGLP